MIVSLNEIEAMGKKAARGAGFDWGIAEEAGKAARWLTVRGLPGLESLAGLLTRNADKSYDELAPVSVDGVWEARSGALCPLIAGAALSDRAAEIGVERGFVLGPIAFPLLLAPYVANAAEARQAAIELSWSGVTLTIASDDRLTVVGDKSTVVTRIAASAQCRLIMMGIGTRREDVQGGRDVDSETWKRLNALASRTYAPATEASRTLGAGADTIDSE